MKLPYKKAMVTGGAGFVGSNLIASLLQDGLEVVSIDDYSTGNRKNLAEFRSNPRFIEAECDITDFNKLESYYPGVDVIFHQACSKMTLCLEKPQRDLAVNAEGALNLLLLAKKYGVKKFVHASTGSVYGNAQYYPTDEKHPNNPVSYYGVSKLAGEKYVRAFAELYGMDTTVLRYFHVYGPKQDSSLYGGVTSIFCRQAISGDKLTIFGDGSQIRTFTYVKDVVNANKFVAAQTKCRGEAYNVSSGVKITINELSEKVLAYFKRDRSNVIYSDWKVGDIKYFDVANQKLIDAGFRFEYDYEAGLLETLTWMEKNQGR